MRTKHAAPPDATVAAPPVNAAARAHPVRITAGAPAGTLGARVIQ